MLLQSSCNWRRNVCFFFLSKVKEWKWKQNSVFIMVAWLQWYFNYPARQWKRWINWLIERSINCFKFFQTFWFPLSKADHLSVVSIFSLRRSNSYPCGIVPLFLNPTVKASSPFWVFSQNSLFGQCFLIAFPFSYRKTETVKMKTFDT